MKRGNISLFPYTLNDILLQAILCIFRTMAIYSLDPLGFWIEWFKISSSNCFYLFKYFMQNMWIDFLFLKTEWFNWNTYTTSDGCPDLWIVSSNNMDLVLISITVMYFCLHMPSNITVVSHCWESTKPHLCSKFPLFKTSWWMLRVLLQLNPLESSLPYLRAFQCTPCQKRFK